MIKILTNHVVTKIGMAHVDSGTNCQDASSFNKYKVVADGCSSGRDSEVGAKLFVHMIQSESEISLISINNIFNRLSLIFSDDESLERYMLFTFMIVHEDQDNYYVTYSGDGNIIYQVEDLMDVITIDDGNNVPPYFAYNFWQDKSQLAQYKDGVELKTRAFSKEIYSNIGVATDGLNHADANALKEILDVLKTGKEIHLKKIINKYNFQSNMFGDDISIVF